MRYILVIMVVVILGCSNSKKINPNEVQINATKFPQVIILGDVLNKIVVDNVRERRNHSNLVEAYIDINSTIKIKTSFQYRFKWYDPKGFEVGKDMSIWRRYFIEGLSSDKLSELAPVGEAYRFKCFLKK
jgi:uncharacterized protein YcfL